MGGLEDYLDIANWIGMYSRHAIGKLQQFTGRLIRQCKL